MSTSRQVQRIRCWSWCALLSHPRFILYFEKISSSPNPTILSASTILKISSSKKIATLNETFSYSYTIHHLRETMAYFLRGVKIATFLFTRTYQYISSHRKTFLIVDRLGMDASQSHDDGKSWQLKWEILKLPYYYCQLFVFVQHCPFSFSYNVGSIFGARKHTR